MKPKKYLGQHFLRDQSVASRIVDFLQAEAGHTIVEIGPGQGVLTSRLLAKYEDLWVIEVDPDAVDWLKKNLSIDLRIIHQDVLRWNPGEYIGPDTFFIGNLPYNISSPFFFFLLEHLDYISEGVFMIQKEVADRICAAPGNKTYGILSILLGSYFSREYGFTVPPSVFYPPPKVQSGVIRLKKKENLPEVPFADLKRVVKTAFNQRRKTLRNALKSLTFQPFEEWEEWASLRAENLDIPAFLTLARHLKKEDGVM
ncbi:MAG: 16S rRNA (adenine(1518)-N(6)/adenine(1519)-N(6))-dimethyltransferase RsmA [Bacteroidota bacterium]